MPELVCAADDPRWHEERRKGVTATDITAIMGLSPYESEYGLYWKKLGMIDDVREDNDRLRLGRDLEPIILSRWGDANPDACFTLHGPDLWRSSIRSWQMATPDSVVYDGEAKEGTGREVEPSPMIGTIELKSWADSDRHSWNDGPPPRVRAQVLWQMDTLDVARGHVGVLFLPSGEFRSYVIEHGGTYDAEIGTHADFGELQACRMCADIDAMRRAGEEFMARLRHELPPPSPDASSASLAALKARFADPRKDKTAEIEPAIIDGWLRAKARKDEAELDALLFEVSMREQAGDASILTINGVKVATRVTGDAGVKAHVRHQDYFRRVKGEADG